MLAPELPLVTATQIGTQNWASTVPTVLCFPRSITPGEASIAGYGDNVDGDTIDNGFRFADTLTWVHGKHDLKFGYEQWYQQFNPLNFQNTSGSFIFGRAQTRPPLPATSGLSGNGIASMLLGNSTPPM